MKYLFVWACTALTVLGLLLCIAALLLSRPEVQAGIKALVALGGG